MQPALSEGAQGADRMFGAEPSRRGRGQGRSDSLAGSIGERSPASARGFFHGRSDLHYAVTLMRAIDLRVDARWIIPIEPAGVVLHHSLLVDDGKVVAVAPTAVAERDYAPRKRVTLPSHALLPGLINAHTHGAMALLRGIADDVPLKPWLEEHIWPR